MTKAVIGLPLAKQEIASEIYSRMGRERMSTTPVRGAEHSDSSQIAKTTGILKQDKIPLWADATERRIDKRIGFVYKDSVITAPTVNCRIESGSFSINSSDKRLILDIYNSLDCEKTEIPYVMPQKSYATAEGMTMKIVSPDPVRTPVDSLIVEFTNSRDAARIVRGALFNRTRLCVDYCRDVADIALAAYKQRRCCEREEDSRQQFHGDWFCVRQQRHAIYCNIPNFCGNFC